MNGQAAEQSGQVVERSGQAVERNGQVVERSGQIVGRRLNIREATDLALAATDAADLDALSVALDARRQAVASGEQPTPEDFDQGEKVAAWLRRHIRETRLELGRVEQLSRGFRATVSVQPSYVNFRG